MPSGIGPLFVFTVILPTLLAVLYFGFLTEDVYVSESRFAVRSPSKSTVTSLGQVLGGAGLSGNSEESNAVIEYLGSRDAFRDANSGHLLERAYSSSDIFFLNRFGGLFGRSNELFYNYFLGKVNVEQDATTQVVHLTVRAYRPAEAEAINARLLEKSETLVNRLSDRARNDAVELALKDVTDGQQRARNAALTLSAYRDQAGIIDPEKEAAVRLQMISKLQDELIASQTQLQQLQTYTPQASQIAFLQTKIADLRNEIKAQTAGVAGGKHSLSAAAAKYQLLLLDSELASKQLAAAVISLQDARAEARRKRAYLERISGPSQPDYPLEPRRLQDILATLALGLVAWGVAATLLAGIREHRD